MRVVISGYYGFGNVGDEAVLAAMLAALRTRVPQAEVVVLSGDPARTRRLHHVAAASRSFGAFRAIAGADLFISGGGSLVQDVTSARSALYYLGVLGLATVLARATMVYAQGVGPLRRWWIRVLAGRIFNRVTVITVRDEDSGRLLVTLGVRRPAHLVADPALALPPAPAAQVQDLIARRHSPRIGLALRPWDGDAYLQPLIDGLRAVRQQIGGEVVALAFHPGRDLAVSALAARALDGRVIAGLPPEEVLAVVGTLDLLVGVRLHALIAAAATGVPLVGLSYDPKVEEFMRRVGAGRILPLPSLSADRLRDEVLAAWGERGAIRRQLHEQMRMLREEALRPADLAAALLTAAAGRRRRRNTAVRRP